MNRLLSIGIECFSSIVFVVPVVIILQYALFKNRNFGKMLMVFVFAFYFIAVFSAVGIPTAYDMKVNFTFNLIPFASISNISLEYIKNTVLNIILFMPMGFLLPVIWKEYTSIRKTVFMGFALSLIIELLQIFTFRLTDIDDLITNTLGTLFGYYLGKIFLSKFPLKIWTNSKNISTKYEPVIILISIFLIAFFLQPFISNKIWNIILSSPLWESIK